MSFDWVKASHNTQLSIDNGQGLAVHAYISFQKVKSAYFLKK
jgi:hypothetical protein